MELGVLMIFIGVCLIRSARQPTDEFTEDYPGGFSKPGLWQRVRSLWTPPIASPGPDISTAPKTEEPESQLQIRQEVEKNSDRIWTRISYQEKGRTVKVKCQEGMTLEFAGIKLQLDPSGVKVQEGKRQKPEKVRPFKALPRATGAVEEGGGQDLGPPGEAQREARESWTSF